MMTPIIIPTILIVPALFGYLVSRYTSLTGSLRQGAVIGLAADYLFFSVGHFAFTDELALMLPAFVPQRELIVLATGLLEIAIAFALLKSRSRRFAGIISIAVLILFFPANVYSALSGLGYGAKECGAWYLIIRAPLQIILIAWSYWFAVKQ